jgi:short-subunit dehydrogenase involved in D-alanine esterification of teichoic acids
LITGDRSRLGLGMAQCFVKAGSEVILVGRNEVVFPELSTWPANSTVPVYLGISQIM